MDALMVALFVVLVMLTVTAVLTVSIIGTPSPVSFLLGAYIVAWAEVVALSLLLSPFHAFGRGGLLIGSGLVLAVAASAWLATGRRRPPPLRPALRWLRVELADPVLGILAATITLALAYAVVLGVATPQNDWDSLTYHLTRAALWIQQGSVSYVPDVADVRINGNPPNAEIGQAWTMLLGGSDRFVWLPSLAAVLALALGVFGVALRAGLSPREAAFGSLVFACLPLVVLQSSTAMNDLVVASFFVVATFFALGTRRMSAAGAALSLGLAFGTKISAPLLLAIYFAAVLLARRRRVVAQVAIVLGGGLLGGAWYALNIAHTRTLDGGMTELTGQSVARGPISIATRMYQLLLDSVELPGASAAYGGLYIAGAFVLFIAAVIARTRDRRAALVSLCLAGAIVCFAPVLLLGTRALLTSSWRLGWAALGRGEPADELSRLGLPTVADPSLTWYGPVGVLLFLAGVVLAFTSTGKHRSIRIAMALAPLAFLLVLAANLPWDPWRGRFLVFPVALAAASWGLAYRFRALAWAAVGLSTVTVALVVLNSYAKPTGIGLRSTQASIFGEPRWSAQTWTRKGDGTDKVAEFVEGNVSQDAAIGVALRQDDFSYPYFGTHLGRRVHFLNKETPASDDETWLIEAPQLDAPRCPASWATVFAEASGFRVLRRTAPDAC